MSNRRRKLGLGFGDFKEHELVNIDYMIIMCKKLVDCFIDQLNSKGIPLK